MQLRCIQVSWRKVRRSGIRRSTIQERRDGIIIHQISQLIKIATRHGMRSVVVISIHARSRGWF
jgi:hypothetical protein